MPKFGLQVNAVSRFYATPCFPKGAGPDYINAAVTVRTDAAPEEALARLHEIETCFGRSRDTRWGQRTLDLDLIAYGDRVCPDPAGFEAWRALPPDDQKLRAPDRLVLPHPRIQDRAFVLVPICDIAPDWRHPVLGQSICQMTSDLPVDIRAEVVAL